MAGCGLIQLSSESGLEKWSVKSVCAHEAASGGAGRTLQTGEHTSGGWSQVSPSQFEMPLPESSWKPVGQVCTQTAPYCEPPTTFWPEQASGVLVSTFVPVRAGQLFEA